MRISKAKGSYEMQNDFSQEVTDGCDDCPERATC
jgi:hypothetical protein